MNIHDKLILIFNTSNSCIYINDFNKNVRKHQSHCHSILSNYTQTVVTFTTNGYENSKESKIPKQDVACGQLLKMVGKI